MASKEIDFLYGRIFAISAILEAMKPTSEQIESAVRQVESIRPQTLGGDFDSRSALASAKQYLLQVQKVSDQ